MTGRKPLLEIRCRPAVTRFRRSEIRFRRSEIRFRRPEIGSCSRATRSRLTVVGGCLFAALLAGGCSGRGDEAGSTAVPLYRDVLTRERTIDSSDLPDEYQFVNPTGLTVDAAGNVYVADDARVKVFDAAGRPLRIIGRPGQGPGEFLTAREPAVGPRGHLAVQESWTSTIFGPDGELQREIQYRAEPVIREYLRGCGITFSTMYRVIPLTDDSYLMEIKARNYALEGMYCGLEPLLLVSSGGLEEIASYHSRNHVRPPDGGEFSLDFQGELLWTLAGTDRLVYTETGLDIDRSPDPPRYRLNLVDLTTMTRDTLIVPYDPVYIPEGARLMDYGLERPGDLRLRLSDDALEILRATDYYPTLKQIHAYGGRLYGFAYCQRDTAAWLGALTQNAGPRRVDLIDLDGRRLAARAEFPFLPDAVRGGRAYRLVAPEDDLARIEIYGIDGRLSGIGQ